MHPASTRNARVLLVEDEPALARFAERALQRAGYIVTTLYNGADALAAMKQTPDDFDVVVSDLTMPGLSGDRLALAVKAARAQLPVILMTGFSTVISSRNAQAHGIDAVLDKPFSAQALVETVTRVLPPTLRR
jgi:DNA-binding NtrC family response regulator